MRAVLLVAFLGLGCTEAKDAEVPDGGVADAGRLDGMVTDGPVDGPVLDGAQPDGAGDAAVDGAADAATPDVSLADAAVPDAIAPDMGLAPCAPALDITPSRAARLAFGILYFDVEGGTGDYRFTLSDDQSGALLRENAGIYLAGDVIGAVDTVTVTDIGCVGSAQAEVEVVPAPILRPDRAEVEPGTVIDFEVEGGSGAARFELSVAGSGGRVTPEGRYTAGPNLGRDRVRVTDIGLETTANATIDVVRRAALEPEVSRIYLPVGSRHQLRLTGGSGAFEFVAGNAGISVDEQGVVEGLTPGFSRVDVSDRFQDLSARIQIDVVASLGFPAAPFGDGQSAGRVTTGDFNGDGLSDALIGSYEMDLQYAGEGVLYLYEGTADGLAEAPVQVFSGGERTADFARDFAVADLDGDGVDDLVVGARLMDVGGGDTGAISIYRGLADGFFEALPVQLIGGQANSDQFGFSVSACDFNGDGRLDLAVGAFTAEDRDAEPVTNNQGAIQIHLGYPDGFLPRPDQVIYGQRFVDGALMGEANLNFGWELSAGDLDGDGLCDLAVSSINFRSQPNRPNDGMVQVFRGRAMDPDNAGGVSRAPVLVIIASEGDPGWQIGRQMVIADLDGDTRGELVLGAHRADVGDQRDAGRIDIFDLDALPAAAAVGPVDVSTSDWTALGLRAFDNLGWSLEVGDVDGDRIVDLVAGVPAGDQEGAPGNSGTLYVYSGNDGAMPDAEPILVGAGLLSGDRLGEGAGHLGDLNGDGFPDFAAYAGRDDTLGPDVGRPYYVSGDPGTLASPLEMPRAPSPAGAFFGRGMAFVGDLNNNGSDDFIAGAPQISVQPQGTRAGAFYIYDGAAGAPEPTELFDFENHIGSDWLGWGVASLGDFDGDGLDDYAVSARNGEFTQQRANYALHGDCQPRAGNQGSVFVFRGTADGFSIEPEFSAHGTGANALLQAIAGGFDFNGDGLSDMVAGSYQWDAPGANDAGAVQVYLGRAADAEGRRVAMCDPAVEYFGNTTSQFVGVAVAALPDLDGDGCDEVAVGAQLDDAADLRNQGAVYILYGYGPGCTATPRLAKLTVGIANAQMGIALAVGELDGDALPDLAIGGVGLQRDGVTTGGVRVVRGIRLAALTPGAVQQIDGAGTLIGDPEFFAPGATVGERAGSGVGIIDGKLLVGGPFGDAGDTPQSGVVRVFNVGPDGVDPVPSAVFVGETARQRGRLGEQIETGMLDGEPYFSTSGIDASGAGLDAGAVYLLRLNR